MDFPPCLSRKRLFQGSLGMLTIAFSPCLSRKRLFKKRKKPSQVSPKRFRSALGLPKLRKTLKPIKIALFSFRLWRASDDAESGPPRWTWRVVAMRGSLGMFATGVSPCLSSSSRVLAAPPAYPPNSSSAALFPLPDEENVISGPQHPRVLTPLTRRPRSFSPCLTRKTLFRDSSSPACAPP